jgi:hypothetical protein
MGLAEDLKALQELREKGELSESNYAAARDAAVGKAGAQPVTAANTKRLISKPTKIFLAAVILLVGFILRDTSLGILSNRASDVSVKTIRTPPL